MSPRSRERGLGLQGGAHARPAESVRCETHGARNDRGAEHTAPRAPRPAPRLRIPPLLPRVQGSRSRRRWGRKGEPQQRAVCRRPRAAHLETSGFLRGPLVRSWGLRNPTEGWRPASPHPRPRPPPMVLEIETEVAEKKREKVTVKIGTVYNWH